MLALTRKQRIWRNLALVPADPPLTEVRPGPQRLHACKPLKQADQQQELVEQLVGWRPCQRGACYKSLLCAVLLRHPLQFWDVLFMVVIADGCARFLAVLAKVRWQGGRAGGR